MAETLFRVAVGSKHDVVRARQRARQIAGMLGLAPLEQAAVAATVFYLADQARTSCVSPTLRFAVEDGHLLVAPVEAAPGHAASSLCLRYPLPRRADALPAIDLAWIAGELDERTPLDLFAEMQRQNQELLALQLDRQALLVEVSRQRQQPAA